MTAQKIIPFYRKSVYGQTLEYVALPGDAQIIRQLTGAKTITGVTRELIRDLTGGMVGFQEIALPLDNVK
jgi:hypothetical protein